MSIGNDGNWVNADRDLDDSNYMSISEWCSWTIRVAAELLDKGASDQLDALRKNVQEMSHGKGGTNELLAEFNQSLIDEGKITEEEHEAAIEESEAGGVDAMIGFMASGETVLIDASPEEIRDPLNLKDAEHVEPTEKEAKEIRELLGLKDPKAVDCTAFEKGDEEDEEDV